MLLGSAPVRACVRGHQGFLPGRGHVQVTCRSREADGAPWTLSTTHIIRLYIRNWIWSLKPWVEISLPAMLSEARDLTSSGLSISCCEPKGTTFAQWRGVSIRGQERGNSC